MPRRCIPGANERNRLLSGVERFRRLERFLTKRSVSRTGTLGAERFNAFLPSVLLQRENVVLTATRFCHPQSD
jgi:hypothetical protein